MNGYLGSNPGPAEQLSKLRTSSNSSLTFLEME